MLSNSNIVFIPGDVSINVPHAIKRAIDKIRPPVSPIKTTAHYFGKTKSRINTITPEIRRITGMPIHPIRKFENYIYPSLYESKSDKAKRVRRELLDAGISFYGLFKSESRILHKVLHPHEHVEAVVYGQHRSSSVMLVATNERIIFLDKKPMALYLDEVSYEVISGLEFEIHTLFATLILHTPVKNYDIRYANLHCAENFARHVEIERLHHDEKETRKELPNEAAAIKAGDKQSPGNGPTSDMAGYYLLPNEEDDETRTAIPV